MKSHLGHAVGTRHLVIHERAGEKLARGRVVDRMLAHRLPDSLRDAAVQLALEQDVIDDAAAIVHRGVPQNFDDAGLRVDLDLGHVCAAGKGARQRDLAARVEGAPVFLREVLHPDRDVGSFHAVAAFREFEIVRRDFQVLCGELGAFANHLARRDHERSAVRHHRARADGAFTDEARPIGIACPQRDIFRIHAERFAHHLRVHRLVPLPRRPCEHVQKGVAGFAEPDHRLFLRRPARARGLDEYPAADAAQLPARRRLRAARVEGVPFGLFHRFIHQPVRVAAVVDRVRVRRLVGESVLRDEIAPAQLQAVDLHLAGGLLHQALGEIADVGPARAAVSGGGRRVGQRQAMPAVHDRDAIEIDRMKAGRQRVDERAGSGEVGARIHDPVDPDREETPFLVERELTGQLCRASVIVGKEGFRA